jgi:hypothetical protein
MRCSNLGAEALTLAIKNYQEKSGLTSQAKTDLVSREQGGYTLKPINRLA